MLRARRHRPCCAWPSVRPCTFAVAASSPSTGGTVRIALIRPHSSATARSTGRMRSAETAAPRSTSHRSNAAALHRVTTLRALDAPPDLTSHEHAQIKLPPSRGPHGRIPGRDLAIAARAFPYFGNDVGVDQETQNSISRPRRRRDDRNRVPGRAAPRQAAPSARDRHRGRNARTAVAGSGRHAAGRPGRSAISRSSAASCSGARNSMRTRPRLFRRLRCSATAFLRASIIDRHPRCFRKYCRRVAAMQGGPAEKPFCRAPINA